MKKTRNQQPARRKRTRAAAKAIRQVAGKGISLEKLATPSMKRFRRYLAAADDAHWNGESSDARWAYESALDYALDAECLTLSPFPIQLLADQAQEIAQRYNPDDPNTGEPLQESVDVLIGQLVERGLVTFDSATGMVSVVPLPVPADA